LRSQVDDTSKLSSDIIAAFQTRQQVFREHSSIVTYQGLNHEWKIVIEIATKDDKVSFKSKADRDGKLTQSEAIFDGKETLQRLKHSVRAHEGNKLDRVDLEDYFTAFNGCRLPKSRIHPDQDRFPDYTVVDLIEKGTFKVSRESGGIELVGGGVTLTLDPNRQFVITKASYAYRENDFLNIESVEFSQAKGSIWIATKFVGTWLGTEPSFEITTRDISWTVPDSQFQFLLKDKENVEDFRPYDGVSKSSIIGYVASSDPERTKRAREEAIAQAQAAGKIGSQRGFSKTTIWLVNLAVVLAIVVILWRRRKARG
jgi:hypothetical protein